MVSTDGKCHTAEATLDVLRPVFEDRIISRRTDDVWPPRSCDLIPLNYLNPVKLLSYVNLTCVPNPVAPTQSNRIFCVANFLQIVVNCLTSNTYIPGNVYAILKHRFCNLIPDFLDFSFSFIGLEPKFSVLKRANHAGSVFLVTTTFSYIFKTFSY